MKLLKIFPRIIKNVAIGAVKSLPIVNVFGEVRDLNLKRELRQVKEVVKNNPDNDQKLDFLKRKILFVYDLVDDGKLNDSVNQVVADKITQLVSSAITTITLTLWLLKEFGII